MASSLSYSHNNGHCCCATATMTTNGHISPSKKRSNPRCHRRNSLPRNMDLAFRYLRPATNESTISITSIQKFLTNYFTTTDTLIMSEKLLKKLSSSNGDIGDYHHCYHHPQLNQLNYLQNNHNCAINTMPIPATYKQSNIVNDAEAKLEEIINLCKTLQMNHHSPSNDGLGDGGRNYYSTIDSIVTSNNHRLSSNDECYCCTIDNIDGEDDRIQTIQSISSEHHHHFGRRPSSLSSAKVSSQSIIPPSPPKITQPLFINDLRLNHDHRRHQGDNYDVNNTPTICNTPNLVQSINKTSIVSFYDDNRRQKPVCARHLDDDQTAHEQQHHHHLQHTAHEQQQQQISSSDTPAAPSSDERLQQQQQRLIIDDDNNRPMVTKLVAKFEVNGGYSIVRQHHPHQQPQQPPHQLRRSFGNRSGHDANGSAAKIDDHRQQPTHQSTGGIQSSDDAPPSMSSSTVTFDTNYHHNDKDQDHYTPKCNTMMMIINQNVSDGNNDKQVIKCNKPKPPPKPLSLTSSMNGTSCRTLSATVLPPAPPSSATLPPPPSLPLSSSKIKDNPPPPPPAPSSMLKVTLPPPPSSVLKDGPLAPPPPQLPPSTTSPASFQLKDNHPPLPPPPPSSSSISGGSSSVGGNHGNDCHHDDRLSIVDNTTTKSLTTNVDNVTSNRDNNHHGGDKSLCNDNQSTSVSDIITMTTSATTTTTTKGVNINPTMTNTPVATSIKTTHTAMASKPSVNLRESAAELSAQSVTAESSPTNFDSRAATADRPCHGYCCYRCCCCSGGRNLVNSINSNKSHSNELLGVKLSSICKCQRTTAPPSATIRTKSSNVTMHNGGATIKYHQSSITNESSPSLASSISPPSTMILKDPPTIEDNIHHHSHPHQPAQQPSFNDKSLLTVNDSIILSSTASATTASSATDAEAAVTTAATDNNSSSSSSDEGIDNPAILDDDFDDDDDIDIDDIDIVDGHNRNQQRLTSPLSPKYSSNHLQPPQQAQQRHLPHSPLHHQHHFNHHSQSIINHPVTAGPDRRSSPNLRHSASKSPVVNDQAKHLEQLRREEQLLLEEIAELESEQRQQSQAISRLPSLTNGNSPVATSNDNEIDEELLEFQRIECEIKLSELRKCLQLVQKQLKNLEAPRSPMNSCNPSMDNHLTPGGHKQQLTNGHNTDDKQPSRKQSSIGQKSASAAAAAAAPLAESEDDDVDGQLNSISDRGLNPDDDSDQDEGDEDLTESNDPKIVDPNLVKSLDDLLQETIETRLDKVNDLDEHEQESFVVESATAESPPLAQQGSPRSEPQQSPSGTDPAKGIIRRISQYDNDRQHDCQMKHFGYQRNFDMLMLKSVYHKLDLDKHQQMAQQSPSPSPLSSSTNPDRDRHKQPNIMSISSISNEMLLEGSTPTPTPTATDSETDSLVLLKHNPQNNLQRFTSKFPSNTTAAAAAGDEQLLSTSIPNDNLHSMKQSSVLLRNKRNSSSSNINDNSNGHQANQQNNHQRPLTLYMPVPNQKINLITHLHQLGHDLTSSIVTNHLLLTPYTCSGYLYKHCSASVGHRWRKRYFHFDRMRKVFVYYHDRSDFEKMKHPKRGVYFDEIQDVYVDHTRLNMKKFLSTPASSAASDQSPSKSATNISSMNDTQQHNRYVNSPGSMTLAARPDGHRCVFVVSTVSFSRKFILSTYTPELMRIWMDVIFTGAQAYLQDFDDQQ